MLGRAVRFGLLCATCSRARSLRGASARLGEDGEVTADAAAPDSLMAPEGRVPVWGQVEACRDPGRAARAPARLPTVACQWQGLSHSLAPTSARGGWGALGPGPVPRCCPRGVCLDAGLALAPFGRLWCCDVLLGCDTELPGVFPPSRQPRGAALACSPSALGLGSGDPRARMGLVVIAALGRLGQPCPRGIGRLWASVLARSWLRAGACGQDGPVLSGTAGRCSHKHPAGFLFSAASGMHKLPRVTRAGSSGNPVHARDGRWSQTRGSGRNAQLIFGKGRGRREGEPPAGVCCRLA